MNENASKGNGADAEGAQPDGLGKHDQVLAGLVVSLQIAAMQQMGKITNPATNAIERDLQQARSSIDILEMLKFKCRSGTPAGLLQMLDNTVMELQMNYVDELAKQRAAAGATPADPKSAEQPQAASPATDASTTVPDADPPEDVPVSDEPERSG